MSTLLCFGGIFCRSEETIRITEEDIQRKTWIGL